MELVTAVVVQTEPNRASLISRAKAKIFGRYDLRITIQADDPGKLRAFRFGMESAVAQLRAARNTSDDWGDA